MDSQIFSKIKKGNVIPSFSLPEASGNIVSLDDFLRKKNLVILFFNKLEYYCGKKFIKLLDGIYEQLKNEETEVLAVSQESLKALREFAKQECVRITLLSDKDGKVMNKFTYRDKNGNNICALFTDHCINNKNFDEPILERDKERGRRRSLQRYAKDE